MASSGSLKDLSKAINAYYSNAPTLPLPDELTQAIEAYLDKHEKFDDQTSEKLHDELQVIYNSHVAGQPSRYASFIAIFRRFVTVIRTPARLFHWWDIMGESVEMNAVQEKGLLEESAAGTMDLLMMGDVYEQENKADGAVNPFAERLYLAWMDKHRPIESSQGDESDIGGGSTERPMREGLIAWGKKKPKDFLLLIDKYFIKSELLFWDNERTGTVEAASEDNDARSLTSASGWEASTFCAESDDLEIRHLASYFTILYGMYPLNFTDYIRKPQRYLRHANAAESDEVDVQPTEIRDRSERFRQSHLLHPNFYTLTIDSEKTDLGRWLNCEPAELVADCMALRVPTDTVSTYLQRQVMLLQNDLNFERYLKQQHMAHIGELRRKQVREAASEAEAQHLILANRNLRNRLDDAKKAEMQIRKESERSRTLAKKWESDLSAKLRTLREESKKTKTTEESLRRELLSAKQEGEKLRKIVCDAEVKELNSRQNMQSVEIEAAEISRLKAEVDRLTMSERDLQAKEVERQTAMNSAAESDNRSEILDLKLASKERELEKTKKLCQSQIAALTMQLAEAREGRRPRRTVTAGDETTAEGTLAASRAKQAELQKQYTNLMRRFTVLQSQYEDGKLAVGSVTSQGRNEFPFRMEGDDGSTHSSSPVNVRSRPHRVFSDSDYLDPATSSFNTTPALDTKPSTPAPTVSTSPGTEGAGSGSNASPDQRIYGRGGVQNRIRKEEKGKKREDGDKKEKKSAGIRGIRGFV
ncbi:hypothetical protein VD0004_g3824 [Verticillium dahliae]|nr:hypothetical protein VD0004_g3824 [Verticillium dahliae]PNH73813.1 hypothetical protein VD0001_g3742 [Verticillium dahliae]